VDTCSIDKQDNTELAEAVNSIFRWYRNTAIWHAYLSEVSTPTSDLSTETYQSMWEADFQGSR
ncbi:hypothetical protein K432DRAFT_312574, partial [Lepidopterella palustris CBS 459.81]